MISPMSNAAPSDPRLAGFLRVSEAAAALGVSSRRVRQLIAARQLDAASVTSRLYLVTTESVERYRMVRHPSGRPRRGA